MRTVGAVARCFDMLCERALSRTTQGELLARKQLTQDKIADAWIELTQFRLQVLHAAWCVDTKGAHAARREIAGVKVATPKVFHDAVLRTMHLHGALGVSNEMPLAKMLLGSVALGIADGPTEVHKATIARDVLKEHSAAAGPWPSEHLPERRAEAVGRLRRAPGGLSMYPGTFAATTPDKPAVIMGRSREVVTYGELEERSARLAQLLYARGLRPGDKIALLAENHPRFYEVYWAAMRSGLYLTTVNRYLAPAEAAYLVNDSGATVCITTAQMAPTAVPMLELIPDCPIRLMMDGVEDGFESYEAALDASSVGAPGRPAPGHGDALLVGDDRPAERDRAAPARPADRRPGGDAPWRRLLRVHARHGPSSRSICAPPRSITPPDCSGPPGTHELGGTVVVMEKFDAEQFWPSSSARPSPIPRSSPPCWCA